ncbi:MAG TPA: sugar metabolism transcriptional regulator [Sedimenticola thiotaurini]|uniref:Sugar metabolism transcriptional regulator n=1 Tax=Sedimenticola thiotaurini TaxID=1543721 RepID=A0A831RJV8_9GAMM|nr:sugar metabolism transcriptional regulator [Sedimenticola thiotaurini]
MILSRIKQYLQQRGEASLADLATRFDTTPEAMRGMLETWIRKGRVQRRLASAACGSSCSQCDPAATEIYTWVAEGGADPVARPLPLPGRCK